MQFQYFNPLENNAEKISVEDFNNNLKEHVKLFDKINHNKILIVGEK